MPQDLRTIRRKIRTVTNIWQITRAMRMVAAARVRRLEQVVRDSRLYRDSLLDLAQRLAASVPDLQHPYISEAEPQRPALVVVAGDKGLCGSYNSLVFRRAEAALEDLAPAFVITVGERAAVWASRRGLEPSRTFVGYGARQAGNVPTALAHALASGFDHGDFDGVFVVHTPLKSLLYNLPVLTQLLPMGLPRQRAKVGEQYIFEPDAEGLMRTLLPKALEARIAQAVIEAAASEQAARMAAMTAATDNAEELRGSLTRLRNRLRQQDITTEMLEIVGGANALSAG